MHTPEQNRSLNGPEAPDTLQKALTNRNRFATGSTVGFRKIEYARVAQGKTVQSRRCPAAVTVDEIRI
jgi:hypothetical protein